MPLMVQDVVTVYVPGWMSMVAPEELLAMMLLKTWLELVLW